MVGLAVAMGPAAQSTPMGWSDLNRRPVNGRLGQSLGHVFEVEATVVRGDDLGDEGSAGRYLLRVTKVNGRAAPVGPVFTQLGVPGFVRSKLAESQVGLYCKLHGERSGSLDANRIAAMEKGYVGRAVRLSVWGTGGFSGMPSGMPPGSPIWQDRGYARRNWWC